MEFTLNNPPDVLLAISILFLIVGGLNWLTISYNETDFVKMLSMGNKDVERGLKAAVGFSAIYLIFGILFFSNK